MGGKRVTLAMRPENAAMTPSVLTPRTLNGIKHRASQIAKVERCTRAEALNLASQLAGAANWNAARRTLPESMPLTRIEARWVDIESGRQGVETLTYPFAKHVSEMFDPRTAGSRLAMFYLGSPDVLTTKKYGFSQDMARGWAVEALRALMFIEATGLIPVNRAGLAYPRKKQTYLGTNFYDPQLIPGQDHVSIWFDPKSKSYVIADEPYLDRIEPRLAAERAEWCLVNQFNMHRPNWRGMYNPDGGARIHLFTREQNKIDLADLSQKIDLLPDDFGHEDWKGVSTVGDYPRRLRETLASGAASTEHS